MLILKFLTVIQVLVYSNRLVKGNCATVNSTEFVCNDVGKYDDPNDPFCSNYYLCSKMPDGSFVETLYSCPNEHKFDPSQGLCSEEYSCPCNSTASQCESPGRFEDPDDPYCVNYYWCYQLPDGSFIKNRYSCEENYYFDPSIGECSEFYNCSKSDECRKSGRYPDYNDLTCTNYHLCTELPDGTFIKTSYLCPDQTKFDPTLEECSLNYTCRFEDESSTAIQTVDTACDNLYGTSKIFTCFEKGRFYNPQDITCTTYFLCSLLRNGSFIQTEYSCPEGSFFDPQLYLCSTVYQCPCLDIEPTYAHKTETPLLTSTAIKTTTSNAPVCLARQNDTEDFICSEKGRFYNPKDESCTKYFLCSLLRNGSFIQTEYTCPANSYFDPDLHLCSIFYDCHCPTIKPFTTTAVTTYKTSTSISTLLSTSTTIRTTTSNSPICLATQNNTQDFVCSEKGRFFNPKDETCTKYFLCSLLRNGSFIQTEYACPVGAHFDPELHLCSILYQCPCTTIKPSTITTPSTSESSTVISTAPSESISSISTTVKTTSSTPSVCLATQNNTEDFMCSEQGRFFNTKDETCTEYFLCNLLRNGSFIQTKYTCPTGSYFDPELHLCTLFYLCPCPTIKSSTASISSTDRTSTSIFPQTSELSTIESSVTTSVTPRTTTSNSPVCFALQNSTKNFICSEKGRFFNPKDETCTEYFLCNLLRNGSFVQTKYICPVASYFDPELHRCSILYQCPCPTIKPTTAFISSTSTSILPKTSELPTTESSVTTSATPRTTTSNSPICFALQNSIEDFICSEKGRFFNPKDETCTEYFLCNLLRNGSFVQTKYICPVGSYFDPELHRCSILYQCPCPTIKPTTASISSTSTSIFPETSELSTTESSVTTSVTPRTTTSNSPVCFALQNSTENFICSEKGRFFNPKDETCTEYFLCNLLRNGSFVQTKYICPIGSYFDPELHRCSILYQCPCPTIKPTTASISSTSTSILPETSELPTTESSVTTSVTPRTTTSNSPVCFALQNSTENFICSEKGRFFNPKDETCTEYFLCNLLRNGSFVQTKYICPVGSYFDPELHRCSILYHCPCPTMKPTTASISSTSTSILPETSELPTTESSVTTSATPRTTTSNSPVCFALQNSTENFICSEKGRFFNPKDETCTEYFLCNLLRNGSFVQTKYICPVGSYFDPELHRCSILYQCPCPTIKPTTASISSTSTSIFPETSELSTTKSSVTTSVTPRTTTSNSPICLALQNSTENFICSEKGRFFNPKDETCTEYFLCNFLRNGSFVQTKYICPIGSYFDPELHRCSILYQCPCPISNPSTTTRTSISTELLTTENLSTTSMSVRTTTSNSQVCLAKEDNVEDFICSEKGRFFNPKDETCTKYFLCSLLRNGSFIQTEYTCPIGSFFDPELHLCSILYQCPCSTSTVSTSTLVSTVPTQFPTTEDFSTTSTTVKITTPSTPICLATQNNTEDFICAEKGRFFNPKDETCTKYFLCSLLRNGSFIQTEYTCPVSSFFDPELHVCSVLYQCPCATSKSSTITTESTSKSSISVSTASMDLSTTTTTIGTTISAPVCLATQNNTEDFICAEKGRFFNPKDETCTKYFLCSLLRNGSFIQTEYTCPIGSFFDPELHLCNILYQCPCPISTVSTSTLVSTIPTQLPTTATTINITTPSAPICLATENGTEDFICVEKGRFFNPKDETCTKYFLCSLLRNGSFIQTEYTCPVSSFFDPELHVCSLLYQCPCATSKSSTITTESTSKSSISFSTASKELSTTTTTIGTTISAPVCLATQNNIEDFICAEKGRFFNPKDETCTKYFLCSLLRNGSFIQTEYTCPIGSFFDPELHLCNILYQCPCPISTVSTSTLVSTIPTQLPTTANLSTTSTTINITTPSAPICLATENGTEDFICVEKGRFFNPKDETCTKYFLCSLLRNGSFIQTEYTCPVSSFFDPELHVCSLLYQCPCATSKSSTITTESTSKSSISFSTASKELSTTTTTIGTTISAPVCLATQNNIEDFICAEKGRFFNPKDETCTKYFLCSLLRNGSFIQTEYTCPIGSFFDPEVHLCSILYQCPCSISTASASTLVSTVPTQLPTTANLSTISTTVKISTPSTPICLATQNDTEDFICVEKGRFFNPKDATCTKYFLCSLLRNGSFIQTEYTCPVSSFFDPELHVCSVLYQCPCATSKSSTITTESTSKSSVSVSTASMELPTTTTTIETTITTTISAPVCLATQNNTKDFICAEKGRFFNPKDETCTKYFLCSLLRNGSFIQTEYTCPIGSFFDPELHLCNILYQCPCPVSTVSTSTLVSTIPTQLPTTANLPTTSTTINITTPSAPICLATENDTEDFICAEKGRFFNPKDETCTKYFLCSLLRNGSFIQTEYTCPVSSFFDPELHVCSLLYQCPCATSKSSTITTESTSKSSISFSTASKELSTTTTTIGTTISAPVCLATQNNTEDFICAEKGRFFNPKDETCTKYFLCSLLRNGSFIQTEYTCPTGLFFDPELHLCNTLYQCPCPISTVSTSTLVSTIPTQLPTTANLSTTSTTINITTPSAPICLATENDTEDFICAEKGRFFNPKDETCTKYFLCSLLRNGSFIQTEYTCPVSSFFDPELHVCSVLYQCPCATSKSSTITTESTSKSSVSVSTASMELPTTTTTIETTTISAPVCLATQNNTKDFICAEKGRFFNPKDETCTKYFLCSLLRNGSFIQTEYTCPIGSFFDPELHLCNILYQCPCSITTSEILTTESIRENENDRLHADAHSSSGTMQSFCSSFCHLLLLFLLKRIHFN